MLLLSDPPSQLDFFSIFDAEEVEKNVAEEALTPLSDVEICLFHSALLDESIKEWRRKPSEELRQWFLGRDIYAFSFAACCKLEGYDPDELCELIGVCENGQ